MGNAAGAMSVTKPSVGGMNIWFLGVSLNTPALGGRVGGGEKVAAA